LTTTLPTPLMQASFRLARAFGWTPQVVQTLTMAQIALYLDLLDQETNG
jgi:hypothetical protein